MVRWVSKVPDTLAHLRFMNVWGPLAYRLALPLYSLIVYLVFHISMLKRYHGDGDYIAKWYSIVLDKDFQYENEFVSNLDHDVCKLRTKEINSLKVQ